MNKAQRKQLSEISEKILELYNEIESIRDEEQEKRDNLPENMQDGERANKFDEVIDYLQNAMDSLEEAKENISGAVE